MVSPLPPALSDWVEGRADFTKEKMRNIRVNPGSMPEEESLKNEAENFNL